ncbi:translocation/assembly module TamB [bacterium]|nr:translocation/assembly module TamB [bacterium]
MNTDKGMMTHKRRKWRKYLLITCLAPLLLIILLLAFTQTGIFKNLLRNFVVRKGNERLNVELRIGSIEGNFFDNIAVKEIALIDETDTVLYLPEFRVWYKPFKILKKVIYIDSLLIDSPVGALNQFPDSTWNISNLTKPRFPGPPDTTTVPEPLGFDIVLNEFFLKDANVTISALDTTLPGGIKDINIRFSGNYSQDSMALDLEQLKLRTEKPDFTLKEISFSLSKSGKETKLEDLVIVTSGNRIDGKGTHIEADQGYSDFSLQSQSMEFEEFGTVIPLIKIYSNPTLSLNANFRNDSLTLKLALEEGIQSIGATLRIANLSVLFDKAKTEQLKYYLDGGIRNLDMAHWLGDPSLDYIINGRMNARGTGITPEDAIVHLSGEFSKCYIKRRLVDAAELTANYIKGNIKAKGLARGNFGKLTVEGEVEEIFTSQKYETRIQARELNAALLLRDDSLTSNLNFGLSARGKGFDPEKIKSNIQLFASHSTFREIEIDSLFAKMDVTGRTASIETLFFNNNVGTINLKGIASMEGASDLYFRADLGNLEVLKGMIQADQLNAGGYLSGRVTGRFDSLSAKIEMKLSDILFNTIFTDSLAAVISIFRTPGLLEGEGTINVINAGTPQLSLQTAALQGSYSGESAVMVLDVLQSDSISAHLEAQYLVEEIPKIVLTEIAINLGDRTWSGGNGNTEIVLGQDTYTINEFELSAPTNTQGVIQNIKIDGNISLSGEEDLQVEIANIELKELVRTFRLSLDTGGDLSMKLNIQGNADKPVIEGNVALRKGYVNQFVFLVLEGQLDYKEEQLSWLFSLIPVSTDSLTISGYLPVNLSLSDPGDLIYDERKMEIRIWTERLPLSVLQAIGREVEEVNGIIVCDLTIGNVIKDPVAKGFFRIQNGAIKVPDYGIDYKDFQMALTIDDTKIKLDKMQMKRDKGKLSLNGYVVMDSSIISGKIEDMQVKLKADKFFVVRHRDFEAQISGEAELSGDLETPVFGGKITVLRSSFNLPALTGQSHKTGMELDVSVPMLVEALQEPVIITDTTLLITAPEQPGERKPAEIIENLRGRYKVIMPKNTWIRSPEMKIEISGDLDLVKEGDAFEIFGFVDIVRGYYDLYGRRFKIKKGNISFQGGTEYNPEVLLEAEYIFRTAEREKKALKLYVTGKALNPTMRFTLNDIETTEGDAISYIMFGRSLDELTYGQQAGIANAAGGSTGDIAKGLAANLLSDQLAKTLGKKLKLDYIELSAEDNWQSATFVVGKYITNDLYMSYMRRIGESKDKDITPQTITLEYELTRFLFIQLLEGSAKESGIDLIMKFEW